MLKNNMWRFTIGFANIEFLWYAGEIKVYRYVLDGNRMVKKVIFSTIRKKLKED